MSTPTLDPCLAAPATVELYALKREYSLYEVACLISSLDPECVFNELWARDSRVFGLDTFGKVRPKNAVGLIFQPHKMDAAFNEVWKRLTFAVGSNDPLKFLKKAEWVEVLNRAKIQIPGWMVAEADVIPAPSQEAPDSGNTPPRPADSEGYSREALLRIIGGLTMLLLDKTSGKKYRKPSGLNVSVLRTDLQTALDGALACTTGTGKSQVAEIFKEQIIEDCLNALNTR